MAEIRLEKVHKRYDNGVHAVKGVDLHILDREFMVLVGPSGCGKTSTLRMVAGLEEVSGGTITLGQRRINDVESKDRDLAMVFQNYALYPHMTVYENMAYALSLRGLPKVEIAAKVDEVARMLGLSDLLARRPKQLSGGQRQRVALGRAIVRHPKAFLFDEPLSNLDAKLRTDMRYELKKLQLALATTMVYVTHDQVEAMTLGDRITVMNKGEIQQVGPPMRIYDQPWNRFVAGFLGTPTMNFLDAVLAPRADGGAMMLQVAPGVDLPLAMLADPAAPPAALAALAGKPVVVGIRPEHLSLNPPAGPGAVAVAARVELIEPMGDHQTVYLSLAGAAPGKAPVVMKAPGDARCAAGEAVQLTVNLAKGHVFAGPGEDARNLTLPGDFPQVQAGSLR
jgi:ABC-type sugar transport system ATPase subunit